MADDLNDALQDLTADAAHDVYWRFVGWIRSHRQATTWWLRPIKNPSWATVSIE